MKAFQLTRHFPDFIDTEAQRDYGIHDTLKKAQKNAQKAWDKWTDENHMRRERISWSDSDPQHVYGSVDNGKKQLETVIFIIYPTWRFEVPNIEYNFAGWKAVIE